MKKILALLLTCVTLAGLTACGSGSTSGWTDKDFTFKNGSETLEVEEGNALLVWDTISYLTTDFVDNSYDEYDGGFATNRGLELGMTLSDFKKLYNVKNGYAVWELLSGENSSYTSFDVYTNQKPSEMYADANSVWLDLGYAKVNGKWKALTDVEVRDVWFCEADLDDFDEVVILSVNLDSLGEIVGIGMYHIDYNEDWVVWQDWAE